MKHLTFHKKILLLIIFSIGFSIFFSFLFIHYLYSKLYLESIEESIIHQGKRTASHYHYGELSDDIIEKIQWYNVVSEYEIIVVDNLDELSSYFPYKINYETLINENDQAILEQGQYILKEGYVEEFNREILGAIFPVKSEQGLIGFIYIYVPLAAIQDVFRNSIPILIIVGIVFFYLFFLFMNRIWMSMFNPLKELQQLSQEISKGNYKTLTYERNDEIGQLINAFNKMSLSLKNQETRKKEFISNVVHELRTPLTYMRGYTEVLQHNLFKSPDEAAQYLSIMKNEIERLNKLIKDLIELNYLQEASYSIEKEPIALTQLLLDTLQLFKFKLKEKEIIVKHELDEESIMMGDEQRIRQIFYNTIDNAFKYSLTGGTITITLKQKTDHIVYTIHNHGIFVKPDELERIGERFYRADKARNRATGGTGLGLSIVKEIVRLHNGKFSFHSEQASGTTVTITFPSIDEKEL